MRLAWIVGRRSSFNRQGIVPVNYTESEVINTQYENNWTYLPLIKSMVALASLFHDFGKCTVAFDKKLRSNKKQSDALRHEFISCLFIAALSQVYGDSDAVVLEALKNEDIDYVKVFSIVNKLAYEEKPFLHVPDFMFTLIWLILGHHRLPASTDINLWKGAERTGFGSLKAVLTQEWGYRNGVPEPQYFQFLTGLPSENPIWQRLVQKWAGRTLDNLSRFDDVVSLKLLRPILTHARLSLIFGDHLYSSMKPDLHWRSLHEVYANTDASGNLKQYLDEHLVGVNREALQFASALPRFEQSMESLHDIRQLQKHANQGTAFVWQDVSVEKIRNWKKSLPAANPSLAVGFFGINIASTGFGKTFANAKIIQALSTDESLRYVLCLGLRTLTLQTGDEYRSRIGLDETELAVLIGSKAVASLHEYMNQDDKPDGQSESAQELLDGLVEFESPINENTLSILVPDEKAKKLLFSPVLACTIDYMILATEIIRGGRWMLPYIRLMSSDLVIDEIDDFSDTDLIAIGRLIHLAGMLGRKVIISSATIPPDMAQGYYRLYQDGFNLFARSRNITPIIGCGWFDEYKPYVSTISGKTLDENCNQFQELHQQFCVIRATNLQKEDKYGGKRKAYLISCPSIMERTSFKDRKALYFQSINSQISRLHKEHHTVDPETGIRMSIGCIRVAHINSCIEITQDLLQHSMQDGIEYKVMPYHSRQVLLLRSIQEKHLDQVLKCKDGTRSAAFQNSIIRNHLHATHSRDLVFILVCTPVEEVGRDHDFDWAIMEPSSFRSIIQLAGRVRRHRDGAVATPNVGIMQYNLKALDPTFSGPVFCKPGFETPLMRLATHDVAKLIDFQVLGQSINSCPRITKSENMKPESNLIDLEQAAIYTLLNNPLGQGPETPFGWLNHSAWSYTALPQLLSAFRPNERPMSMLINVYDGVHASCFQQFDPIPKKVEGVWDIHRQGLDPECKASLWLERDYEQAIEAIHEHTGLSYEACSVLYGEIQIPDQIGFHYSDQFGMKKE
jgi:CRISPR-associated endonuclease/helicase Cas3